MARTNKYACLNFNDIYDKKIINNNKPINPTPSSSSIHNKTKITNSHIHGNMLVLTRPTPKPISQTPTPPPPQPTPVNPDPTRTASNSDSISLRPLGSTGGSAAVPRDLCFVSPKPDKFVPPHLRPGYVCKEEKPVKNTGGYRQRQFGEEINRPKSGGGGVGVGYDRMRKASTGPDFVFRPGSSGNNRPNSTG